MGFKFSAEYYLSGRDVSAESLLSPCASFINYLYPGRNLSNCGGII